MCTTFNVGLNTLALAMCTPTFDVLFFLNSQLVYRLTWCINFVLMCDTLSYQVIVAVFDEFIITSYFLQLIMIICKSYIQSRLLFTVI